MGEKLIKCPKCKQITFRKSKNWHKGEMGKCTNCGYEEEKYASDLNKLHRPCPKCSCDMGYLYYTEPSYGDMWKCGSCECMFPGSDIDYDRTNFIGYTYILMNLLRCENCHRPVDYIYRYCPWCGTKFKRHKSST